MQHISEAIQRFQSRFPKADQTAPVERVIKCATCNDVGFVRASYPVDHPLFGKLTPCPDCGVVRGAYTDEYGLLPADRALTWAGVLDVASTVVHAKAAVQKALDSGWGWVYLHGGYGTAKTHILKTAVATANRSGVHAVYNRMSDLFDTIREAYDHANPNQGATKRLGWFANVPVLAIDEIEKVSETPFVAERRFQLLDRRYEAATRQHYGVTILAGNVPPENLDGAIASRIQDQRFTVVDIGSVGDLRLISDEL